MKTIMQISIITIALSLTGCFDNPSERAKTAIEKDLADCRNNSDKLVSNSSGTSMFDGKEDIYKV